MENKYYTPDVEDLKIGYGCEFSPSLESKDNGKTWITHWKSITIDSSNLLYILGANVMFQVRTKYLIKEDIESLGWVQTENPLYLGSFEKKHLDGHKFWLYLKSTGGIFIHQYIPSKEDNIWSLSIKSIIYDGSCKSINELKTIQKLLNI